MNFRRVILGMCFIFSLAPKYLQAGCVLKEGDKLLVAVISSPGIWSAFSNKDKDENIVLEIDVDGQRLDSSWKEKYGNNFGSALTCICDIVGSQNIFAIDSCSIFGTFFRDDFL